MDDIAVFIEYDEMRNAADMRGIHFRRVGVIPVFRNRTADVYQILANEGVKFFALEHLVHPETPDAPIATKLDEYVFVALLGVGACVVKDVAEIQVGVKNSGFPCGLPSPLLLFSVVCHVS